MKGTKKTLSSNQAAKATTTGKNTQPTFQSVAEDLVAEWAKQRKHTIWLGGPSRKEIEKQIASRLKEVYYWDR